jgi:acyl-CoA synthetase (NDP forming)
MNDLSKRNGSPSRASRAIERMMRPKSVAIVGISSKPATAGHVVLNNLTINNFTGDIHLVNRSGGTIAGRPVLASIDELPEGVDVAVFTLPAAGVRDAVSACVRRKVGVGVIFASGFAESGDRATQEEIAKIARDGGLALIGPNCLGYQNYVDGLWIGFTGGIVPMKRLGEIRDPAFAVISQSGGLGSHFKWALEARDLPVAFSISTGNEAVLGLADFIEYLADEPTTKAIIAYVEQIRRPAEFLAAVAHARSRGKPVLIAHPGRSAKGKAATGSHTGALAGDHAVMRARLAHAGVPVFESLDEMVDAAEVLARFPHVPSKGLGILTFSGAFCAISYDMADDLGLDLPPLSPATEAALKAKLPPFAPPRNPLDLGTQALWDPDLVGFGTKALLDDPAMGALLVSIPHSSPKLTQRYLEGMISALEGNTKPFVLAMLGDRSPLPPEFVERARERRIILSRSSEESLIALAHVIEYGQRLAELRPSSTPEPFSGLPKLGSGPQPEWLGKQLLAAIGIKTPQGALAKTLDEAGSIAARLGYPVAMKAQAAALAHKTEAGGVALNLADAAAVHGAWEMLHANIGRAQPGLKLDGVLIEKMAPKGLELMVGAKRDPTWGPIVLVGLGGIWVEALGDVRLLPPDLPEPAIVEELHKLRSAKLLSGFRGAPPVDVEAVAHAASLIGRLMLTHPEILEIDVNPLFAHARGAGVTAVDALIITR